MNVKSRWFKLTDILLLILAGVPLVFGIVLKILTNTPSEGISIAGAGIYFTIPMPLQDLPITESQVNSWLVMLTILFVCLYLTHGIATKPVTKRQVIVEWIIEQADKLVVGNMGDYFRSFSPFFVRYSP